MRVIFILCRGPPCIMQTPLLSAVTTINHTVPSPGIEVVTPPVNIAGKVSAAEKTPTVLCQTWIVVKRGEVSIMKRGMLCQGSTSTPPKIGVCVCVCVSCILLQKSCKGVDFCYMLIWKQGVSNNKNDSNKLVRSTPMDFFPQLDHFFKFRG